MTRRRGRRALLVVVGTLLGLVAVEVGLQVVSYLAWAGGQRESAGGGAATAILCVGDSYTWGMGASDASASYPAQVEALLRAAGTKGAGGGARAGPAWCAGAADGSR